MRSYQILMFLGFLCFGNAGCTSTANQESMQNEFDKKESSVQPEQQLVAVRDAKVQAESIVFKAVSFGCTDADSFAIESSVVDGTCRVSILRTVPDVCKAAASIGSFKVPWSKPSNCEGLPVLFENREIE